ncbi:hypothetical protein GCM10007916_32810 [Psychromonas marina]|uniref:Uncharacterized protein n=1 Tax=Psychromonas marina TaxID=88364 RepID=A0ABQ6E4E0_9GAMM|nr:hypothetical protein [Psychromonas marina]GLS92211.1 hypothetical protein GCM10007916_32810 [Psychromonas marina]
MDMQDEMLGVLTLYHGENDFDVNPYIPSKIEHYARASLGISDDDYIMATMRTSFGKFHRGLVISRDGIYWLNSPLVETNVNHLSWRELSDRKSKFRSHPRSVSLGDGAVFDNKGSLNKSSFIINILDLLIVRYEAQEIESDGFVFDQTKVHTLGRSIPDDKETLKAENIDHTAPTADIGSFINNVVKKLFGKSQN